MPIVKINMLKGKSEKYKKAVMDAIHYALMDTIGIPDEDRFQRVVEFEKEDFEFASDKTSGFMIIEIKMFPGRTKEQKGQAIEKICKNLQESVGIIPTDVFILIEEPPLENWGMAGQQKG